MICRLIDSHMLAIDLSGPATVTAASSVDRDNVLHVDVEESEAGVLLSHAFDDQRPGEDTQF